MNKSDKDLDKDKGENKVNTEEVQSNSETKPEENNKQKMEDKLKDIEDKLLRSIAELENQRRRFEKEKQEAFEFGGFGFALENLAILDNIDRATSSFKNDTNLKNNKDLDKIH